MEKNETVRSSAGAIEKNNNAWLFGMVLAFSHNSNFDSHSAILAVISMVRLHDVSRRTFRSLITPNPGRWFCPPISLSLELSKGDKGGGNVEAQ